jgi:hypothetical protein
MKKLLPIIFATSLVAGTVGGTVGFAAAQANLSSFPAWANNFQPVSSTATSFIVSPDHLKAIRLNVGSIDYWFADAKSGHEAVIRADVSRLQIARPAK